MLKNLTNFFKSLKSEHLLILVIAMLVILLAIFFPRQTPLVRAGVYGYVGNVGGKLQLEGLETFDTSDDNKTIVLFFAPWCGHCKRLMPEWDKMMSMNNTDVKVVKVNADENKELSENFEVKGFPTIYFLPKGLNNPEDRIEYKGERKGDALLAFVKSNQ